MEERDARRTGTPMQVDVQRFSSGLQGGNSLLENQLSGL